LAQGAVLNSEESYLFRQACTERNIQFTQIAKCGLFGHSRFDSVRPHYKQIAARLANFFGFHRAASGAVGMWPKLDRRRFVSFAATCILGSVASGCGTIIHPERRGQPAGRLDPAVVLLDGIGLLLFLIPGIIAFAVDFSTGAIYLPPTVLGDNRRDQELKKVALARSELTQANLEKVISEHAGRQIHLDKGAYHTSRLTDLASFWPATDDLIASYSTRPDSSLEVLRCQSP